MQSFPNSRFAIIGLDLMREPNTTGSQLPRKPKGPLINSGPFSCTNNTPDQGTNRS